MFTITTKYKFDSDNGDIGNRGKNFYYACTISFYSDNLTLSPFLYQAEDKNQPAKNVIDFSVGQNNELTIYRSNLSQLTARVNSIVNKLKTELVQALKTIDSLPDTFTETSTDGTTWV